MLTEIISLKNGDEKTFKKIVESYSPRLYKFSMIYVINYEVAKEIVQDTFVSLWKNRRDINDDTCLISYLMKITKNNCLNYLKSFKLETLTIHELTETEIYRRSNKYVLIDESLDILMSKELHQAITLSLEKLPSQTRKIFMMSRYDGFKNREIALHQDISIKSVEFHIRKALKHLQYDLPKEYLTLLA